MNSPTSDNNQLRLKGIELATTAGALKTAGVIEDRRFCYKDIFDAAIAEVGPESFLAGVLQGPPIWAQMVKKFHPELFAQNSAILAPQAEWTDPNAAKNGDRISLFTLNQQAIISGIANIHHISGDRWVPTDDIHDLKENSIYTFIPSEHGISAGDTVCFFFGVQSGGGIDLPGAPEQFIYDPSSPKIAHYGSWGPAGTVQFHLQGSP